VAASASAGTSQVSRTWLSASATDSGSGPGKASGSACASRTMSGTPTPMTAHGAWSAHASLGGRSSTIRPPSMSTTRSAHGATSSTRCSMITTPVPSSRASLRRVPSTSWAPTGSRSDSGSSSTRIRGRIASVAAIAVRCFWPPDNVTVDAIRMPAIPVTSRHQSTRAAISGWGRARFSGPNATSDWTVWLMSWRFGFWKTMPTS
jgi:hypothetical protein